MKSKTYQVDAIRWHKISLDRFDNFDELVQYSVRFIEDNMDRFREIKSRLLGDINIELKMAKIELEDWSDFWLSENIFEPRLSYGVVDQEEYSITRFELRKEIDYISRNIENKRFGNFGENVVQRLEQRKVDEWIKEGKVKKGDKGCGSIWV